MTQSRSSQAISLQLMPMQIAAAIPAGATEQRNLFLYPGEPSEMVVQVRNWGSRSLQLYLQVTGDFPQQWCRIGMEGSEIPVGQQMEAVLYFQIPADFFEQLQALGSRESLQINYLAYLHAHAVQPDTGWRQVESTTFNLYVRPRSLYLDFLPGIYREVDLVGRLLKIFEQSFEPAVQTLDSLWAYLDPLTAPQALLPFLAQWVAWQLQPQLGLSRQRQLIRSAIQIYRWRGTRRGLRFYLHLVTDLPLDEYLLDEADKHIGISESFGRGAVFGESRLGEDAILGGGRPFHFIVHLRPDSSHQIDESLVRSIIEQEKPAFCTYDLYIEPRSPDDAATSATN